MAEISSLNGYDFKDKVAREQISYLQTSFDSHNHDSSYETKTDASAKLEEAKSYADSAATTVKNDLLNGAGEAYDTLKELGELIDENSDAITVLNDVAAGKADKEHTHTVSDITDMPEVVNADWNENDPESAAYIQNRTHWDNGNIIEWDGNPNGRLAITISNGTVTTENVSSTAFLSKVSDIVISPEEAIGGVLTIRSAASAEYGYLYGETGTLVIEDGMFTINNETMWMYADGHLVCVLEPVNGVETGLYFIRIEGGGWCVTSFKWGDLKQLDEKYIPDTIARVEDVALKSDLDALSSTVETTKTDLAADIAAVEEQIVQSDWNVNDPESAEYIQNRPFYTDDPVETVVVKETSVEIAEAGGHVEDLLSYMLVEGETYIVTWNGVSYECIARNSNSGWGEIYIGNQSVASDFWEFPETIESNEPFFIITYAPDSLSEINASEAGTHTFSITHIVSTVYKIESKYLTQSDWNENDPMSAAYVQNRTHYFNREYLTILEKNTFSWGDDTVITDGGNGTRLGIPAETSPDFSTNKYKVVWDGDEYYCESGGYSGMYFASLGNHSLSENIYEDYEDTGEPFLFKFYEPNHWSWITTESGDHTVEIYAIHDNTVQLDEMYIPDTIARKPEVDEALAGKADASHTHAISEVTELQATLDTMQSEIDANESSISIAQTKLATIEEGAQANVQADWNDNDPTSAAYVKNRTHWIDDPFEDEVLFESENVEGEEVEIDRIYLFEGEEYRVVFDDVEYTRFAYVEDDLLVLGYQDEDPFFIMGEAIENEDSGAPMSLDRSVAGEYSYIYTYTEGSHSIKISHIIREVHKISEEFLPNGAMVGEIVDENHGEIFNDYEHNVAIGEYSHAEGYSTKAYGNYSHAEGLSTQADGYYSHAEGYGSKANKTASHAEGYDTTANGYASHAEGYNTTANGSSSHAEGRYTTANGDYSHAEGYRTIASSDYQHVQGMFNIEDVDNTYAHIVGNGENDYSRSNVHTLDWDGNAWFAGTIKLGGTSYDDASEIALKSDLDSIGIISDEEIDAIFASI